MSFGGFVGGLAGGVVNGLFNDYEASRNRDWQEHMSDTQWQRGVADMKAAGINPLLAVGGGAAKAGTPSGATAAPLGSNVGQAAVSTALQVATTLSDLKTKKAQRANIAANTLSTLANTNSARANFKLTRAKTMLTEAALPAANVESGIDKSAYGTVLRWLGRLNPLGHSALSFLRFLK